MPEKDEIEFYENWFRLNALKLHREINPGKKITAEEFFRKGPKTSLPADREVMLQTSEAKEKTPAGKGEYTLVKRKSRNRSRNKKHIATLNNPGPRRYIVDSGASFHLVSKETLSEEEQGTISPLEDPIPIQTANGEVVVSETCRIYVHELGIYLRAHLLDCTVAVLSLGLLCDKEGYSYSWRPKEPPFLSKGKTKVVCYPNHNVPFLFPGLSPSEPLPPAGRDPSQSSGEENTSSDVSGLVDSSSDEKEEPQKKTLQPSSQEPSPSKAGGDSVLKKARKPRCLG
jgi:hypothetical protein